MGLESIKIKNGCVAKSRETILIGANKITFNDTFELEFKENSIKLFKLKLFKLHNI